MHLSPKTYRIAFWSALVVLFVASSIPDVPVNTSLRSGGGDIRLDYLFHFLAYVTIGFLYLHAYQPTLTGIFLIIGYAVVEEIHQYWIPGRTLNPVDLGFDLAGLGIIILIWFLGRRRTRNRQ
mgnify:CR=1 FL=1